MWFDKFSFSPFASSYSTNDSVRYLQQYYLGCLLCFLFSFISEYFSQRRYNWQAKAFMDHNPLIIRKGLKNVSSQVGLDMQGVKSKSQQKRDEKAEFQQWKEMQQ